MRTFYLAASYPRRKEAIVLRDWLVSEHLVSNTRWLDIESQGKDDFTAELAIMDVEDIAGSDFFISLTGDTQSKGGRHTELGIAIALHKPIVLIGMEEQIFHMLPFIHKFVSEKTFVEYVDINITRNGLFTLKENTCCR